MQMTLEEAEGYLLLGLCEEAWLAVDDLPPEERTTPPALRIRMCAAIGLGKWDAVQPIAEILRHLEDPYRFEAACAFQALAAEFYCLGAHAAARRMVTAAIDTNPGHRILILDDARFPEDFI
jgi:hypothetical protein